MTRTITITFTEDELDVLRRAVAPLVRPHGGDSTIEGWVARKLGWAKDALEHEERATRLRARIAPGGLTRSQAAHVDSVLDAAGFPKPEPGTE